MADPIIESIEEFGLSKKKKSSKLFSKVGIVGGGNDGQYMARVCSSYGIEVILVELSESKIAESFQKIEAIMDGRIKNWGATEGEKRAVMSRIHGTTDLNDLKDCDLVIEAIRTDYKGRSLTKRKKIFEDVEKVVDKNCIIATNSVAVIVSDLSEDLVHKDRCISIHFMINSNESRIVEVTRGLYTSDDAYGKVKQFVKMINRVVIPVEESVGLISVRMFVVILNEACEMVLEGVGDIDHVERLMQVGYGMRFGPFTIADKMGLDRVSRWMENLFNEFGSPRFKPNPLLKRLLRQRRYGILSGRGFFVYDDKGNRIK